MASITVICCVCGEKIAEKDGNGVDGVSHGYCRPCYEKEIEAIRAHKQEAVDVT